LFLIAGLFYFLSALISVHPRFFFYDFYITETDFRSAIIAPLSAKSSPYP